MALFSSLILTLLVACENESTKPHALLESGTKISLELATTEQERIKGLSHRKELKKNHGMLFVYNDSRERTFWMKDCFIALDMLWLSKNGVVQDLAANVPPSPPGTPEEEIATRTGTGQYILELAAGEAKRLGIKVGSKIDLKNLPES